MKCKVKIIKATRPTFWYAKHIGEVFEVTKSLKYKERYELILTGETLRSFIREEDCELVD